MRDYYRRALQLLGHKSERRFISRAVENLEAKWCEKNLFVVEAPTGYGKTTITATLALKTLEESGKLIAAYPLRTLLEDQYSKLERVVAGDYLGKRYMHEGSSPYLIKPITITTVDTLSLTMFGLAPEDLNNVVKGWVGDGMINSTRGHYLFAWSSVILSDVVLDEVHLVADESKSLTYLVALLEHVMSHEQRVVLMSATMPTRFKEAMLSSLRSHSDRIEWMEFKESERDDDFVRSRLEKSPETHVHPLERESKLNTIKKWLDDSFDRGFRRALIVFNTVNEAISFYRTLDGYKNRLLIHSRFTEGDRRKKQLELERLKRSNEYVIVATQVIEAGIDISSNLLITDLSPMCSTIQRFGRFLRYEDEKEGVAYVWHDTDLARDTQQYKVYDRDLCESTLEALREAINNRISLHVPTGLRGYKRLLDRVYSGVGPPIEGKRLDEMLRVFTNLGDVSQAVELFMDMEGSFVRSSAMITVQSAPEADGVSIELRSLEQLLKQGLVRGQVVEKDGRLVSEPLPDWLPKYATNGEDRLARRIIGHIFKHGVKGFLIEGSYSEETGLEYRTVVGEL